MSTTDNINRIGASPLWNGINKSFQNLTFNALLPGFGGLVASLYVLAL